jgi:hypothetical protein
MKRYKILYDKNRHYTQLRPLKYTKLIDIRLKGINWRFKNAHDRNRVRVLVQQLTKNGKTNLSIKLLKKTIHELKTKQTKRRSTGLLYVLRGIKKLELLTELRSVKKRGRVRYHKVKLTHPQKRTSKAVQALLIFCRQEAKRTRIPFHLVLFEEFKDLWTYQSRLYRARREEVKEIMETKFRHTFEKKQKLDIKFILAPRKKIERVITKKKLLRKIKQKLKGRAKHLRRKQKNSLEYRKRCVKRGIIYLRKTLKMPHNLKWGLKRFLKEYIYSDQTKNKLILKEEPIKLKLSKKLEEYYSKANKIQVKLNIKNFFNKLLFLGYVLFKKKFLYYTLLLKKLKYSLLKKYKNTLCRNLVITKKNEKQSNPHKEIITRKQKKKHILRPSKHGESRYLTNYKHHERTSIILKQVRNQNIQSKEYLNSLKKIKSLLKSFKKKRKC